MQKLEQRMRPLTTHAGRPAFLTSDPVRRGRLSVPDCEPVTCKTRRWRSDSLATSQPGGVGRKQAGVWVNHKPSHNSLSRSPPRGEPMRLPDKQKSTQKRRRVGAGSATATLVKNQRNPFPSTVVSPRAVGDLLERSFAALH